MFTKVPGIDLHYELKRITDDGVEEYCPDGFTKDVVVDDPDDGRIHVRLVPIKGVLFKVDEEWTDSSFVVQLYYLSPRRRNRFLEGGKYYQFRQGGTYGTSELYQITPEEFIWRLLWLDTYETQYGMYGTIISKRQK